MSKPAGPSTSTSARERLLAAATELFYAEGIHTVGIDRIIERAGVAKASLYNTFGSKDELVRAYLQDRHVSSADRITTGIAGFDTPRDRLLGVFTIQSERMRDPAFRGCAFANATAESEAGGVAEQATDEYRAWVRSLFTDLATELGVPEPGALAEQLVMLYDGANASARMDRNPGAALAARAAAEALLDAALVRA